MAEIWREILGVDRVSVHDNFFEIGGHSLLSVQAIARIEKQTGVRLHPAQFMVDSLEQIAAACERGAPAATQVAEVVAAPVETSGIMSKFRNSLFGAKK